MTTSFVIISAIICLLVVFLILRNMYECDRLGNSRDEKIKVPLYAYILTVIICIIPIFNIIATILFIGWTILKCCEKEIAIKGPIGKIASILNKKI